MRVSTKLSVESWLIFPAQTKQWFRGCLNPRMHTNKAIVACGGVCHAVIRSFMLH
jgi:hypothetical protein